MFVVVGHAAEEAMPTPNLHGARTYLQTIGDLALGQHPARAEPIIAGAETVAATDVAHNPSVEGLPGPRETLFVQPRRDLAIGVGIE